MTHGQSSSTSAGNQDPGGPSGVICPTIAEWSIFLTGELRSDVIYKLQGHLDSCATCLKALSDLDLAVGDPLLVALRHSSVDQEFQGEARCQQVVAAIAEGRMTSIESDSSRGRPPLMKLGSYQIEEMIAEGGMGVVYRAVHVDLHKTVALKLLRPNMPLVPEIAKRFRRECRALGRMQHPNLVQAFDAGVIEGTPFLIMELIEGIDLAKLLKQRVFLSAADACEIIRQAASGLEHAAQKGIVHRDIKPSNLMLTRDLSENCVVKVLDLGLARVLKSTTGISGDDSNLSHDGQIMGTRAYMSPEQARNSHDVDTRADVYSLGATLHELLVGQPPGLPLGTVPDLSMLPSGAPAALRQSMASFLAHDREHRPASPGEVARQLSPLADGHRIDDLL